MGEPTWRYFLTFPWATMTRDVARRDGVRRREEEGEGKGKADVKDSVDGDAIAPPRFASPWLAARRVLQPASRTLSSYPLGSRDWLPTSSWALLGLSWAGAGPLKNRPASLFISNGSDSPADTTDFLVLAPPPPAQRRKQSTRSGGNNPPF
jgi:hypothetical protein